MNDLMIVCGVVLLASLLVGMASSEVSAQSMLTRWADDLNPDAPMPEYPRPQMVRQAWENLNGRWDYAIVDSKASAPEKWDGKITVPFAIESQLSGVMKRVGDDQALWYRRTFATPELKEGGRLLLHFGAVDWHATVWVNGKQVGEHRGGYDAFSFDITDTLNASGDNELLVKVVDPTDGSTQPHGKQIRKPHGIWYTPVTGIWQTVWLEPVSSGYIESIKIMPDLDNSTVSIVVNAVGAEGLKAIVIAEQDNTSATGKPGEAIELKLDASAYDTPWGPDSPQLYDMTIELVHDSEVVDVVASYFALRKIEVRKTSDGFNRLFLNNKPVFQYGPLDQGWWPDGLYTAPTDKALAYDIQITRAMGFNMARKHVKVEPARWYYHADRLGLLVWQDMPNGDASIGPGQPDITRSTKSEAIYREEWEQIVTQLYNHPSIVVWVPFNEGWGQFKTNEILAWTKQLDPTRLVNGPSGWEDRGEGDMHDMHNYPGPGMFPVEDKRASVLGEFGGLGLPLAGHLWQEKENWGYRSFDNAEALTKRYEQAVNELRLLVGQGLAAAVYTQTTDVEGEVNGLLTYDRDIIKIPAEALHKLHAPLYAEPPKVVELVPTSEVEALTWSYTFEKPADGWEKPDFDGSAWQQGPAGFGTEHTPRTTVRTVWDNSDIWIRRGFELKDVPAGELCLRVYHDEDAEVYINGLHIMQVQGYSGQYMYRITQQDAKDVLQKGSNTIAVHCKQTKGGQYIDVGLSVLE